MKSAGKRRGFLFTCSLRRLVDTGLRFLKNNLGARSLGVKIKRMVRTSARSLLCLILLGAPVVLSSTRFEGKDRVTPARQSSIARCREYKKAERTAPPFRDPGGLIACPPGTKDCGLKSGPAWYLSLDFFETLTVADDEGHRDKFPVTQNLTIQTVGSVSYLNNCPNENCVFVVMPVNRTYELTFTTKSELMLDVVKGIGNECPDEAIRYLGQLVPDGSTARLRITPRGVEDLRYDKSGNGNFSFAIKPTGHVFAPKSWDTEGPSLKFSQQVHANTLTIIITSEDESGVKTVMYSVDDSKPYRYDKSIKVDRARPHLIRAFADDVLGNRSGLYEYTTKP
jgi:hypothetical protein